MPEWITTQLAEYGILGIVIFGLIYVIRFGYIKYEQLGNSFAKTVIKIEQEHRNDRKDWHEAIARKEELDVLFEQRKEDSQERRDESLKEALDGLKEAIIMQNSRKRGTD